MSEQCMTVRFLIVNTFSTDFLWDYISKSM